MSVSDDILSLFDSRLSYEQRANKVVLTRVLSNSILCFLLCHPPTTEAEGLGSRLGYSHSQCLCICQSCYATLLSQPFAVTTQEEQKKDRKDSFTQKRS